MNYDASISTDVSLSKVLDEMILDGTDLEVKSNISVGIRPGY